ncbi:MAG: sensor histidine kinase [Actinomycetota bacterium]
MTGPSEPTVRVEQDPAALGIGRLFWITSDAIVGADLASGSIVLWNPAAEALFGYPAEEAIGSPLARLVPDDLHASHLDGIQRYRSGGDPVLVGGPPAEVRAVTKDGELVDVALTLTDVSTDEAPEGGRRYVLALIRDVTAIRTSERELQRAMNVMREFVAAASHDLRTPLASVTGFSQTMLELGDRLTPEKQREFLAAIARGATQAARLVDDLLTLSHIQAGVLPTNPQDVAVGVAVRETISQSGVAAEHSIDDRVLVHVDPHHLDRMLINLLTNARRHGSDPIIVSSVDDGAVVDISVSDGGSGVAADFIPRLFDRFARADSSKPGGSGLGLSITRGLARANGGDAYYERVEERCTFGIRLPASPQKP